MDLFHVVKELFSSCDNSLLFFDINNIIFNIKWQAPLWQLTHTGWWHVLHYIFNNMLHFYAYF